MYNKPSVDFLDRMRKGKQYTSLPDSCVATDGHPAPLDSSLPCGLLALPPELRNTILEYLFTSGADDCHKTCRQIRDEAQALFYHLNHLEVGSTDWSWDRQDWWLDKNRLCPTDFLDSISTPRLEAIRTLTCLIPGAGTVVAILKRCRRLPRLETLQLRIVQPMGYIETLETVLKREWYFVKKALQSKALHQIAEFRLMPPSSCDADVGELVQGWEDKIRLRLGMLPLGVQ